MKKKKRFSIYCNDRFENVSFKIRIKIVTELKKIYNIKIKKN